MNRAIKYASVASSYILIIFNETKIGLDTSLKIIFIKSTVCLLLN